MLTNHSSPFMRPTEAAVLLVLLATPDAARPGVSGAALAALQQQLGAAVRVLRLDASSHPAVVSSFHATELPCFVLVHHGNELWRQCGLPDAATVLQRLGQLGAASVAAEQEALRPGE